MDIQQPADFSALTPFTSSQPLKQTVIQNELKALKNNEIDLPLERTHSFQLTEEKAAFLSKVLECLNKVGQKTGNETLKTYADHSEDREVTIHIDAATKNAWNQLRLLGLG